MQMALTLGTQSLENTTPAGQCVTTIRRFFDVVGLSYIAVIVLDFCVPSCMFVHICSVDTDGGGFIFLGTVFSDVALCAVVISSGWWCNLGSIDARYATATTGYFTPFFWLRGALC